MPTEEFIGIDLGTTTTLIARARENGQRLEVDVLPIKRQFLNNPDQALKYLPSVAYFPAQDKEPLVGKAALDLGPQENPARMVRAVKRQMGRRLLLPVVNRAPHQVAALYLQKALSEARQQIPNREMVFTVTVPASFTSNQRADTLRALREACEKSGVSYNPSQEGHIFISEPVAAMLAFLQKEFLLPQDLRKLDFSRHNRVVVYDIGGGTLDLTMVFVEPRNPDQPVESLADLSIIVDNIGYYCAFGGEDFDLALAKELHSRFLAEYPELESVELSSEDRQGVRLQLMNIAKEAKEKLSESYVQMQDDFMGDDATQASHLCRGKVRVRGTDYTLQSEITWAEYCQLIEPLLHSTSQKSLLTPLRDLLERARFEAEDLDGILLVGGMARLPLVKDTLTQHWGDQKIWIYTPPDHAVVTGAAVYSYLRRTCPGFSLQENAADAYYVRLEDKFDLILPARSTESGAQKKYYLSEQSDHLRIQIFAGEEPKNKGQNLSDIYHTLIHQGGATIPLGKTCAKGTDIYVQMCYEGNGGQDHTKMPWVFVWIGDNKGNPIKLRYSDMLEEKAG